MCRVSDLMKKDEQYARGVLRLEKLGHYEAKALQRYATELETLREEHAMFCKCAQTTIEEVAGSIEIP